MQTSGTYFRGGTSVVAPPASRDLLWKWSSLMPQQKRYADLETRTGGGPSDLTG